MTYVFIKKAGQFFDPSTTEFPYADWYVGTLPCATNDYAFTCNALPDAARLMPAKYNISIPEPGATGGRPFSKSKFSGESPTSRMRTCLEADGGIILPYQYLKDIAPMAGHYLAAMYLDIFGDHQSYRRHEETGIWFKKRGWANPVNAFDRSGNQITDPQTADRGGYNDFAAFFFIPNAGIKLDIKIELAEDRGYQRPSPARVAPTGRSLFGLNWAR